VARRRQSRANAFVQRYPARFRVLEELARHTERVVIEQLQPLHLEVHQVSARAKSPDSTASKIRKKQYGDPVRQLTDQIGVRVILHYSKDVDTVANALRAAFDVDPRRSIDKRKVLGLRQFGYRSVHLLVRLGNRLQDPRFVAFKTMWFEIQVRSILDHAWAEIEHELCYKSGASYPDDVLRQFGALAGALELVDAQFEALRSVRDRLIDQYREAYSARQDSHVPLDALRLIAIFEALFPSGASWRRRPGQSTTFPTHSEVVCCEAIHAAGITTAAKLRTQLARRSVKSAVAAFASLSRVGPAEVSHMARAILLVGVSDRSMLSRYPELLDDAIIRRVLRLP
jgi:ppGpp synthetase/RelA/SpoT-type nucleotidyltranferase